MLREVSVRRRKTAVRECPKPGSALWAPEQLHAFPPPGGRVVPGELRHHLPLFT